MAVLMLIAIIWLISLIIVFPFTAWCAIQQRKNYGYVTGNKVGDVLLSFVPIFNTFMAAGVIGHFWDEYFGDYQRYFVKKNKR